MNKESGHNPYIITKANISEPPDGFFKRLKFLGPGLMLTASIVGSGELIATTRLGAEAGFVTFWVIIVSCLVKVTVQLEFGKHAIYTGESTMEALNKLPGPRIGRTNWSIYTWLFLMIFKLVQVGGIVGGTALVLNIVFPQISVAVWCFITAISVSLLIYRGRYTSLEKVSMIMIALFTLLTIVSVIAVQATAFHITLDELLSGLSFHLPGSAVFIAIAAFGLTGVGGDEILAYNYWLIEKGYAACSGPREETGAWQNRARGWIRVMYSDAIISMFIYTTMTAAFYLLGAAILHRQELLPQGMELVETLSLMYTDSLGKWAGSAFLVGAFFVLYSTLFGALAIWTRLFSDAFSKIGLLDFKNTRQRHISIAVCAWALPLIWAILFLVFKAPAFMVAVGGLATTVILLMVVFAALHFKYKRLPAELHPGRFYNFVFWVSVISIILVAIYGLVKSI